MTGRFTAVVALFAVVFGAGAFLLAPASLLNPWLQRSSSGALQLANANGTLWNGSGSLLLKNDTRFVSLGAFAWKIHPARLLFGVVQFDVRQGEGSNATDVRLSPFRRELTVAGLHAALPAQALETLMPELRAYRLNGEITLDSGAMLLSGHGIEGRAEMNWTQAGSTLSDVHPLGSYRIQLEGAGPALNLALSTQSGKLLLSGNGRLEQGKGLAFNGAAQAAKGEYQEALSSLLRQLGPESIPGVFTLALNPQ